MPEYPVVKSIAAQLGPDDNSRLIDTPEYTRFHTARVANSKNIKDTVAPGTSFSSPNSAKSQLRLQRKRHRFLRLNLHYQRITLQVATNSASVITPQVTPIQSRPPQLQISGVSLRHYARLVVLVSAIAAFLWIGIGLISSDLPQNITTALEPLPRSLIAGIIIIYLTSGMVKGALGIGMGLLAVPAVGLLANPVLAVALVAVPLIVTNFHQGVISGDLRKTLSSHAVLAWIMMVVMTATVFLAANIATGIVAWTVGLSAIIFAVINLGITLPEIPRRHDKMAQIITGCCAGMIGGVSGLVVIPLVIYMMLRNIQKERFVAVSGFLLLLSGLALLLGGILNGNLQPDTFILSAMAAVPAMLGIFIGEQLRNRLSGDVFRKMILFLILAIGLKTLVMQVLSI